MGTATDPVHSGTAFVPYILFCWAERKSLVGAKCFLTSVTFCFSQLLGRVGCQRGNVLVQLTSDLLRENLFLMMLRINSYIAPHIFIWPCSRWGCFMADLLLRKCDSVYKVTFWTTNSISRRSGEQHVHGLLFSSLPYHFSICDI